MYNLNNPIAVVLTGEKFVGMDLINDCSVAKSQLINGVIKSIERPRCYLSQKSYVRQKDDNVTF